MALTIQLEPVKSGVRRNLYQERELCPLSIQDVNLGDEPKEGIRKSLCVANELESILRNQMEMLITQRSLDSMKVYIYV